MSGAWSLLMMMRKDLLHPHPPARSCQRGKCRSLSTTFLCCVDIVNPPPLKRPFFPTPSFLPGRFLTTSSQRVVNAG